MSAEAKEEEQLSLFIIAQQVHEYSHLLKLNRVNEAESLHDKIIALVLEENMADYYVQVSASHNWPIENDKVTAMRSCILFEI